MILPYLEQKPLYDKIDLTKAWDDPANAEAVKSIVSTYQCPSANTPQTHTTYMAVVTSNSCIRATEPRLLSEITDGVSNTLMVIEADLDHAVHWMSPRDADEALLLAINEKSKLAHTGGIHVALVDGSVRFLNATVPASTLRALISIAGKDDASFW